MNKAIHLAVIKLGIEEFLVGLRRRINVVRRFIPKNVRHKFTSVGRFVPAASSYPKDDCYFLKRDDTSFKINRSDYVQWRIFYGVRDNALQYAKRCLADDSIVLDIGANCGGFSLKLATYAAQQSFSNLMIHAFEPNPFVVRNYNENLALNPSVKEMVHIHCMGLGNEDGERSFHFPDINTGVGRVLRHQSGGQFNVTIERLDNFVSKINPTKISFIKMIVEGFEPEIFKGGWEIIKKYRPPIFFEVTPEWYRENNGSLEEILVELNKLGYKFIGEFYNEMIPYDGNKFDSLYQYNLLATSEHQ